MGVLNPAIGRSILPAVHSAMGGFIGDVVPGDPAALWLVKNGVLQPDVIGLSVDDYDQVDPAYRSIFFTVTDGVIALVDSATSYTNALASPLLNKGTVLGSETKGVVVLYPYDTPESTLKKAYRYILEDMTFYHVDAVAGDDDNDGLTEATAFATIAKLNTVLFPGINIGLARGSRWAEMLDSHLVDGPIAVRAFGSGPPSQLDCADTIPSDSWTAHETLANVYQREWLVPLIDLASAMVLVCEGTTVDNAELLLDVTSLDVGNTETQVEANAGSYFYNETTHVLYLHPTGSGDPATNGKVYTATKRPYGIYSNISAVGDLISGIHTRRNGNNNGSIASNLKAVFVDSIFDQGHKHNAFLKSGHIDNCYFINARHDVVDASGVMLVFYGYEGTESSSSIKNSGFIVDTVSGGHKNGIAGIYAHGGSSEELDSLLIEETFFVGAKYSIALMTKSLTVSDCYLKSVGDLPRIVVGDATNLSHETVIDRCLINHSVNVANYPSLDDWTIRNSAIYWNAGGALCDTHPSAGKTITFDRVTLFDANGAGRFSVSDGAINVNITKSIFISATNGHGYHMRKGAGTVYAGDFNIFYRNQFSPVVFDIEWTEYQTLAGWQAASGQDLSVTLSAAQYASFWLNDPATGDFRINPAATCTWADGTVSTFFADGVTPLTAAGAQEHYDWSTGQVVAGPPTEWPDAHIPLTRAQIIEHLSA